MRRRDALACRVSERTALVGHRVRPYSARVLILLDEQRRRAYLAAMDLDIQPPVPVETAKPEPATASGRAPEVGPAQNPRRTATAPEGSASGAVAGEAMAVRPPREPRPTASGEKSRQSNARRVDTGSAAVPDTPAPGTPDPEGPVTSVPPFRLVCYTVDERLSLVVEWPSMPDADRDARYSRLLENLLSALGRPADRRLPMADRVFAWPLDGTAPADPVTAARDAVQGLVAARAKTTGHGHCLALASACHEWIVALTRGQERSRLPAGKLQVIPAPGLLLGSPPLKAQAWRQLRHWQALLKD